MFGACGFVPLATLGEVETQGRGFFFTVTLKAARITQVR